MLSKSLISFAAAVMISTFDRFSVSAVVLTSESPITLSITAHLNTEGGSFAIVKADRARLETIGLFSSGQSKDSTGRGILLPAKDSVVSYIANIGIGEPPTTYSLLVDTGSANTWIGAGQSYKLTRTSQKTKDTVSVTYGTGFFSGEQYLDKLFIGTAAFTQSIGVASFFSGFQNIDGILGIGPTSLTIGTLFPDINTQIPTVTDNLKSQNITSEEVLGISFEPTDTYNSFVNGQLDFGGTSSSRFTGNIQYTPITARFPYDNFWGIDQDITYGHSTPLTTSSPAIVDTGTTLLYLPYEAFLRYVNATQAAMDTSVGLLTITAQQFDKLESLFFTIGGAKYEFNANAQIWPRALNTFIGGSEDQIYLIVANGGNSTIPSVNGFVWLQRFYSVFDTDKRRIGFAPTAFTASKTN